MYRREKQGKKREKIEVKNKEDKERQEKVDEEIREGNKWKQER